MDEINDVINDKFQPFNALVCASGFASFAYTSATTAAGMYLNLVQPNFTDSGSDPNWRSQGFMSGLSVQYNLTSRETAEVSNVLVFVGAVFGTWICGPLADSIGRVPTMSIGLAMSGVCHVLAAYSPEFWQHLAARTLLGFFLMFEVTCKPVYGCEVHTTKLRAVYAGIYAVGAGVGLLALPLLCHLTKQHQVLQVSLAVVSCVPLLLTLVLPESPRWLAQKGRNSSVTKSLRRIRRFNCVKSVEQTSSSISNSMYSVHKSQPANNSLGLIDSCRLLLKHKRLLLRGVVVTLYVFGAGLNFYGCCFVVAKVVTNLYVYSVLMGLAELPYIFVFNIFSRRVTMLSSGLLTGALTLAIAAVVLIRPDYVEVPALGHLNTALGFLCNFFSTICFNVGIIVAAETFPTSVRNTCVGFSNSILRIGCVLAPAAAYLPSEPVRIALLGLPLIISSLCIFVLPDTRKMDLMDALTSNEHINIKQVEAEDQLMKQVEAEDQLMKQVEAGDQSKKQVATG